MSHAYACTRDIIRHHNDGRHYFKGKRGEVRPNEKNDIYCAERDRTVCFVKVSIQGGESQIAGGRDKAKKKKYANIL